MCIVRVSEIDAARPALCAAPLAHPSLGGFVGQQSGLPRPAATATAAPPLPLLLLVHRCELWGLLPVRGYAADLVIRHSSSSGHLLYRRGLPVGHVCTHTARQGAKRGNAGASQS